MDHLRVCPKCGNDQANEWLEEQKGLLLEVTHFLVTFTLPEELRAVARSHQKVVYNILFRASSAALQKLALDPRFVGGRIGMMGVLHTWTHDLRYHPHVHYIVAFKYLAPYIFRVAITGNQILKLEDGKVIFKYKESATDRIRISTLTAEEFIRRFLQHVLPARFVKVRYYGLLSPSNRQLLERAREMLGNTKGRLRPAPAPAVRAPNETKSLDLGGDVPTAADHRYCLGR